uniref:Exocyst subunit Exo70 family protein n=1 Tax=Globisporangium ultimum (strain ATCC 200006 / CBS 805.95 / DAOM BR144) TaxID=431595 RepID=K3W8A3_GLOUD
MEIYGAYRSNVARIRDAITENKTQMRQVNQSLGMFQSGLLCVEREMLPIYKLTERLRETQKNIDLCVQELRKINENFIAAHELSPTLMNGSKFDQDEYVKALQKLLVAIAFLENHKSYEGSTKALDQAKELLAQARKKCKADFVSAVGIISRGSRDENNNNAVVWSAPSKKETAKVAQLLHCLLSSSIDQTELLTEYGKQRFQVVKMILCEESSLVNSIGFHPATEAIGELTKHLKDIEVSISAEKSLAGAIFPNEELSHAAFRYAAYPILDALKSDVDAAFSQITSAPAAAGAGTISGKYQLDPFKLLRLHELFVARVGGFEALISPPLLLRDRKGIGRDDPWVLSKAFTFIVSNVATVAKQKLFGFQFELTDNIGVSDRSLSKDGNVHPVSSYMLSFLRQLCEHTKPLGVLLQHDSNMTPTSFIETVVMQLVKSLQSKSAQFKGRNDLKQLFLANNFGYIANSLPHCAQKSDELQVIEVYIQSEIKPRILELRDNAIAQLVDVSYASFQTFLVEPKEKLVYARGSDLLTLESGRLLKEKFARFNTQLDDIYKTQKHFIVSEPQIRHQIIQAAVDAIIPYYTKFYEKFSKVHFSKKNSAKYLKYTPKAAEQALKELFLGEVVTEQK